MALGRLSIAAEPAHHWRWSLLRARPERPDRHAAEHRDELAPLQLIESRPAPNEAKAGLQNIELAQISQEVVERFCNESTGGAISPVTVNLNGQHGRAGF